MSLGRLPAPAGQARVPSGTVPASPSLAVSPLPQPWAEARALLFGEGGGRRGSDLIPEKN